MNTANPAAAAQHDDGTLSAADLIAAYGAGPAELRAAFAGFDEKQLRARPIAGKWSAMEVLCHLEDAEQFFADRIKRVLGLERPLLMGVDPSGYPHAVKYHDRDREEELSLVELTRSQIVRILKRIDADAWHREGVHSESGLVSVRGLLLHAIRHQAHHLKFVEEKRRALS